MVSQDTSAVSTSGSVPPALDPPLYVLYQAYKRSTATVLNWLRANAVDNLSRTKKTKKSPFGDRLQVKQILQASELISKRKLTAPQYVQGAFKHALVNRRKLTEWYRQAEFSSGDIESVTEAHEYFNNTLAQAYETLFPAANDGTERAAAADTSPANSAAQPSKNFYEVLSHIEEESELPTFETLDEDQTSDAIDESLEAITEKSRIEDDPLEDVLALHFYVLEMDSICSAVKQYWRLAATGGMPVPLAAWLTNAGFAAVKSLSKAYSPAIGGHRGLVEYYSGKKSQLMISGLDVANEEAARSGRYSTYQGFSNGFALITPAQILKDFKREKQRDFRFMNVSERQPISSYFVSPAEESRMQETFELQSMMAMTSFAQPELPQAEAIRVMNLLQNRQTKDRRAMESVLRSIKQLINQQSKESASLKKEDSNPLLPELKNFLQDRATFPDTSLVFGLQLLLETCKSFVWKDDSPNPLNCRMMALRFAQEVKQSIREVIDQEVTAKNFTSAMANGLYEVSDMLKNFMREKRLDLYYQSPWAAGAQMVEMLGLTLESSLSLCNQRGIVGTVLHVYNAVQQLTQPSSKISLLEELCDLFLEPVFLGTRPTSNFDTIFYRFLGGSFERTDIRDRNGQKRTITVPKPQKGVDDSTKVRIHAHDLSLFHDLFDTGWRGSGSFWMQVFTNKKQKTASKREMARMEAKLHEKPFADALHRMKDAVSSEFYGTFPIVKVNFFAVYMLCVDILTEIARRWQTHLPEELRWAREAGLQEDYADAAAGFGFVAILLGDVDARHKNKTAAVRLSDHSGLRLAQEAISTVCGSKELSSFMWKTF